MNAKEKRLAAEMLELASDEFSNHGCNDVDDTLWEDWTLEERKRFVKEFHDYNGDPEEYDPDFLHLGDDVLMGYMAHKLRNEALTRK